MSTQRHFQDVEQVLRHFMHLELIHTRSDLANLSTLLALNYFVAAPDPEARTVTMNDWRGLDEAAADRVKMGNYKRLERWLDGTTRLPAGLIQAWVDCLEVHREDALAAIGALFGCHFEPLAPGVGSKTLCQSMKHFADLLDHNADIFRDGVIDHNDADTIREFGATADKLFAALQGFRLHLNEAAGLPDAVVHRLRKHKAGGLVPKNPLQGFSDALHQHVGGGGK